MRKVEIIDAKTLKIKFSGGGFHEVLNAVRSLEGRNYDPDTKVWTAYNIGKNISILQKLNFTFSGGEANSSEILYEAVPTPYKSVDQSKLHENLFDYQIKGVEFLEAVNGRGIISDQMGCIDGEAIISVNRNKITKKHTIASAYKKFHNLSSNKAWNWNRNQPTYVRALLEEENRFGLNMLLDIVYQGKRKVLQIETQSGKVLNLTFDHKVINSLTNSWCAISSLKEGDSIIVNGEFICKHCGSNKDIITYKYAKFRGFCKKCVYKYYRNNHEFVGVQRRKGKDGYVYLTGSEVKNHHRKSSSGVLEHVYIMEKLLGREIGSNEEIHHKNGIRDDNRLENLQLCSSVKEHRQLHKIHKNFGNFIHNSGSEVITIPKSEQIIRIEMLEEEIDVYDLVMEAPNNNFIANGIVVHNCGKSAQAVSYLKLHQELLPALIVCPASVKINWQRELMKWGTLKSVLFYKGMYILSNTITIINYDILWNNLDELLSHKYRCVIGDEMQYVANSKAKRTKAFRSIARKAESLILLSGTPIRNRPREFFTTLNLIDPDNFNSQWNFYNRYCGPTYTGWGWKFDGATNVEELHNRVTPYMIRRRKEDVLKELPSKQKFVIPLNLDEKMAQTYLEESQELRDWIQRQRQRPNTVKLRSKIEDLNYTAYLAKRESLLEYLNDLLQENDKVVVFAYHINVLDDITNHFKDVAVRIDGSTPTKKRQDYIDAFQTDPNVKLFIGQMLASGVGINLTASSIVCFAELWWVPSDMEQCIDRCHRIGTKDNVQIYYLMAADTEEDDMALALIEKYKVVQKVLDGKETPDEFFGQNLEDYLFNKYSSPSE